MRSTARPCARMCRSFEPPAAGVCVSAHRRSKRPQQHHPEHALGPVKTLVSGTRIFFSLARKQCEHQTALRGRSGGRLYGCALACVWSTARWVRAESPTILYALSGHNKHEASETVRSPSRIKFYCIKFHDDREHKTKLGQRFPLFVCACVYVYK